MYGYIYIVTNKVNNKQYIGKHKSSFFDPLYLGSGTVLKRAKLKYGINNFYSTLIEECDSLQMLNEREKYWIEYYDAINSDAFYNVLKGGDGGFDFINTFLPHSHLGKHLSDEAKHNISMSLTGKKKSDTHRKNLCKSKNVGESNPNYGKLCYTDGIKEIHIFPSDVNYYESIGYYRGRPQKVNEQCKVASGTKWYTNGKICVRIKDEDVQKYIELGYVPGRKLITNEENNYGN